MPLTFKTKNKFGTVSQFAPKCPRQRESSHYGTDSECPKEFGMKNHYGKVIERNFKDNVKHKLNCIEFHNRSYVVHHIAQTITRY